MFLFKNLVEKSVVGYLLNQSRVIIDAELFSKFKLSVVDNILNSYNLCIVLNEVTKRHSCFEANKH